MYSIDYSYSIKNKIVSLGGGAAFSTKSLAFDGVDDNIICGELPVTTTLTAFSFSLWVKVGSTTTRMNLTSSPYNTWNDNFAIYYEAGTTTLKVEQGASVKYENTSTTLPVGTWTHLCFVFDASESTAATKSKCYINGISILNASAVLFVSLVDKDEDLYFGCRYLAANGSKAYFYDGNMDEASFFNIALSSGDVSDIYNLGSPTDLTGESGLVSWWRMGENSTFSSPQILMPENTNKDKFSNYSMEFDGIDDEVNCGDTLHNDGQTPMTVSAWVKITTAAGHTNSAPVANKKKVRMGPTYIMNGWAVNFITSGAQTNRLHFELVGDGTIATGALSKKALTLSFTDGLWHNVVVTYDGSESAAGVKFYIDGTEDTNTQTLIDTFSGTLANDPTVDFQIGKVPKYGGTNYMDGNIDELAIFNSVKAIGDLWDGTGKPTDLTGESGLVGYWKMGEEAIFNSTNWLLPNKAQDVFSRYSLDFDGVNDYIQVPNSTDLDFGTGDFTWSLWVNYKTFGNYDGLLFTGATNSQYRLKFQTSGQLLNLQNADGDSQVADLGTNIAGTGWHHLCLIRSSGTITTFLDGSAVDTDVRAGNVNSGGNDLIIGDNGGAFFTGNIDEVSMFDSAKAIGDLWDGSGKPTDLTGESGIVAWWRMGEDATFSTNWTIPDKVGSNNGTSANMTIDDLVGEAPTTSGNGISDNMTIEDRTGDAPDSENNALSYNMDAADIVEETP
jgi:hypothetical protein